MFIEFQSYYLDFKTEKKNKEKRKKFVKEKNFLPQIVYLANKLNYSFFFFTPELFNENGSFFFKGFEKCFSINILLTS